MENKLAIIFPVLNQHPLTRMAIEHAVNNLSGDRDVDVIVLDNASDTPFDLYRNVVQRIALKKELSADSKESTVTSQTSDQKMATVHLIRLKENIGVYPTFWEGLKHTDADVIAYLHTDLIINEKGWDTRLLQAFGDNKLGLVGFVGSHQLDSNGGRGFGTTSNFQGSIYQLSTGLIKEGWKEHYDWRGSPAEAHGLRNSGYTRAAVVDGCAMVFRRSVLEFIKQRPEFPPHHFYDRLLSAEVREHGFEVAVLGIGCDHISGQTVNQENAYSRLAEAWCVNHGLSMEKENVHNWDSVVYREAERQFLKEYRDIKHLIPLSL